MVFPRWRGPAGTSVEGGDPEGRHRRDESCPRPQNGEVRVPVWIHGGLDHPALESGGGRGSKEISEVARSG